MTLPFKKNVVCCLRFLRFVLFIFAFLFVSALFAQEQTLHRVVITGNKNIKRSEIKKQLRLKSLPFYERMLFWVEKPKFNSNLMYQDVENIKSYLNANGFLYAEIETYTTETRKGRVNIEYRITENQPVKINNVSIIVNDTLRIDGTIRRANLRNLFQQRLVETQSGKIFRDSDIYHDIDFINNEFVGQGYLKSKTDFRVHLHEDSLKTTSLVDIEFLVSPERQYYIKGYEIIGNRNVDKATVLNQMTFRDSLIYREEYVSKSRENLMRLGTFRSIQIFPNFIDDSNFVYPTIRFIEQHKWDVKAGSGWGNDERFRAFVQVSHLGMYKKADQQQLSIRASYVEPWNIQFRLLQPAFFHPRLNLTVNPFTRRENERSYMQDKYGSSVTLSYLFLTDWNMYFSFLVEQNNMREMKVPEVDYEKIYSQSTYTTQLDINYSYPKMNPFRGVHSISGFSITEQGFNSLVDYYFLSQELRYYQPFRDLFILALRGHIRAMNRVGSFQNIPMSDRLYLGGISSVRGYNRNSLGPYELGLKGEKIPIGGLSSLLYNVEARIPINDHINTVFFYDFGQVFSEPFTFDMKQMSQSIGIGFRYVSVVGVLRIDAAQPTDKAGPVRLSITIGESF